MGISYTFQVNRKSTSLALNMKAATLIAFALVLSFGFVNALDQDQDQLDDDVALLERRLISGEPTKVVDRQGCEIPSGCLECAENNCESECPRLGKCKAPFTCRFCLRRNCIDPCGRNNPYFPYGNP